MQQKSANISLYNLRGDRLMIKYITVVGGGSTGHAAAAYLTGKGFAVTLCDNENFKEELEAVETEGGVMLSGTCGKRNLSASVRDA